MPRDGFNLSGVRTLASVFLKAFQRVLMRVFRIDSHCPAVSTRRAFSKTRGRAPRPPRRLSPELSPDSSFGDGGLWSWILTTLPCSPLASAPGTPPGTWSAPHVSVAVWVGLAPLWGVDLPTLKHSRALLQSVETRLPAGPGGLGPLDQSCPLGWSAVPTRHETC